MIPVPALKNLKSKLNSEKFLKNAAMIMESEKYIEAENRVFKFAGVTPYEKQHRDQVDWLYLLLWMTTSWYQFLLLVCFFFCPPVHWMTDLLGIFYDPYFIGVSGYGIFNIIHRYYPRNRRQSNAKIDIERRKRRNGHRFIGYWWINFLTMLCASAFFNYSADLSGPMGISLKTALACSAIGFGYELAKRKLANTDLGNIDISDPQSQAPQ